MELESSVATLNAAISQPNVSKRPNGRVLASLVACALAMVLGGCGSDGEQTHGCEDIPQYNIRAALTDGGLSPQTIQAINKAHADDCITKPGHALSLCPDGTVGPCKN